MGLIILLSLVVSHHEEQVQSEVVLFQGSLSIVLLWTLLIFHSMSKW